MLKFIQAVKLFFGNSLVSWSDVFSGSENNFPFPQD